MSKPQRFKYLITGEVVMAVRPDYKFTAGAIRPDYAPSEQGILVNRMNPITGIIEEIWAPVLHLEIISDTYPEKKESL